MQKNINAVYVMHSIMGLAGSLIGIFIPVYLLNLGYPVTHVFLYYFVDYSIVFVFFCVAAALSRRTGVRLFTILSFPFLFAYLGLLYALHFSQIPLWIIASLQGIYIAFYWFSLAVIWPIFIYLTFQNVLSVGIIGTLTAIGSPILALIVGTYTDRITVKTFMRIGAVLMALLWVARYFSPPVQIILYVITLLAGLVAYLIEIPFTSYIYTSAKKDNPIEFMVYREIPVTAARLLVYGSAFAFASMKTLFLLGALVSGLLLLF